MATEAQKKELQEKVSKLVTEKFGGSYQEAFERYGQGNGKVDDTELGDLLYAADVGNWLTRRAWAEGIMEELDTDGDGCISWQEFAEIMK